MPVSQNWRNLRDFLRRFYNREVNEWFRDEPDPLPDNSTSRKQAKRSCLVLPKDSQNIALLKVLNFRYVVQRSHLKPDIYGRPIGDINSERKYRPFIGFYFLEDDADVDPNYRTIKGELRYRLIDHTSETITNTDLSAIAIRIKNEFGVNNGYVWRKGKDLCTYTDKKKGYQFSLLVRNKEDGKELVSKLLGTNNDTPNWKYLSYKESDNPTAAYPTIPANVQILGNLIREPRIRPIANVRFQYAYCSIWGLKNPIILYDRSYRYLNPLVN